MPGGASTPGAGVPFGCPVPGGVPLGGCPVPGGVPFGGCPVAGGCAAPPAASTPVAGGPLVAQPMVRTASTPIPQQGLLNIIQYLPRLGCPECAGEDRSIGGKIPAQSGVPFMFRRRRYKIAVRYALSLLREFRWSLLGLSAVVLGGAALYAAAPAHAFAEAPPALRGWPLLVAWMNLFGEAMVVPRVWYLAAVEALFPLVGIILVGEGIVRLTILMFSRRLGEKEWMTVMASTYRDHIIVCGLGHLGYRLLGQLRARDQELVVIERDPACSFLGRAREEGAAVLVRDMRDDQALRDAGIELARVIVVASNDDLANIEVALDARRMNPGIRILLRLFDQRIADKFKDLGIIDEAFSSAALAAPVVADLVLKTPAP